MPTTANKSKVSAVKGYGSHVVSHGTIWDESYAHSLALSEEKGLTYIHPFKDRFFMAGNGTMAFELIEEVPDLEAVLIPIGGGGLFCGISIALRQLKPDVRIIGVEPTGAANMSTSRRAGKSTNLDAMATIADGLATKNTDPDVFAIINDLAEDFVAVTDEEMLAAIRFLLERAKLLAEPAGAATVAALLSRKVALEPGTRVVAVVSGGNFDVEGRLRLGY
jgi:threonine dehydratase